MNLCRPRLFNRNINGMASARNLCGFATYLPDKVGQGLADSGRHCHACLGNIFTRTSDEKKRTPESLGAAQRWRRWRDPLESGRSEEIANDIE